MLATAPTQAFVQGSLDDLGTPLAAVTFCVVDLETTGGSAANGGITEIGAVKLRGGECLGTFQTLVNPGQLLPPFITVLTGITQAMLVPAPRLEAVLPSLLEFMGDAVIVGHNIRYDLGFLNAAMQRTQRPRLANRSVDTCALARRLVRDEVPNCKLGTLADRFRLPHQPSHRALDDALATGDLLHLLLERAAAWGVLGLDDLLALPKLAGHPQSAKLRLTEGLPRAPGVYVFRDRGGRALYVGKATNLRARVRSYFSGEERRKIGPMLREAAAVDHTVCRTPLEAAVLEVRLIHQLEPRFNRQAKTWRRYAYVKLTDEAFPRLSVVRAPKADGARYLGPLPSSRAAKRVIEAVHTVVPLRRCAGRVPRTPVGGPCAAAQLGVATCPCAGGVSVEAYGELVQRVVRGFTVEPSLLLDPLAERMATLARAERFEEAADMRDRADALASALRRQRRFESLRRSRRIVVDIALPNSNVTGATHRIELHGGELVTDDALPSELAFGVETPPHAEAGGEYGLGSPLARDLADELSCVAAWFERYGAAVRLVHCDGALSSALPLLPSFTSRPRNLRE